MDDKRAATRLGHPADEITNEIVVLDLVDADAMLDGDRDVHRFAHRLDAVGHQLRLCHQAGAEGPALHALGRAAAVQVDFRIAPLLAQLGRHGKVGRLATAQLQRDRVFGRIEIQMARDVAMQQRAGGHHLGVQPGVAAELAVEHAAMAVSPVHHRCHRYSASPYISLFPACSLSFRGAVSAFHFLPIPPISSYFPPQALRSSTISTLVAPRIWRRSRSACERTEV
ncbi:hypothetical protein D9M72_492930 [compost metagenome]